MFGILAPCAVQHRAKLPLLAAAGQESQRIRDRVISRNRTIAIHSAHAGVGESSSSSSNGSQPSFMARIIPPPHFLCQVARQPRHFPRQFEIPNTGISVRPIIRCLECRRQRFTRRIGFRPHHNLMRELTHLAIAFLKWFVV